MRRSVLLLVLCSFFAGQPGIFPQTNFSAPRASAPAAPGPILVELFTSEGCSDCPPADALLRQLDGTRTAQGQPVIVLSEHVTYWDHLGWKDSFSDVTFTYRQNGYSGRFNLDSVYTPQMVVNGTQQFVGNNAKALVDALHAEAPSPRIDLQIVSVEAVEKALLVHFSAGNVPAKIPGASLDVMAAITDDLDETKVQRGENGGRTLTHVAVVRSLARIAEVRTNTEETVRIAWPSSLRQSPEAPRHLVLFVQQHDFGPVVGAVTRSIAAPAVR